MSSFGVALGAEAAKITRSTVVRVMTALLGVVVPALGAGLLAIAGHDGSSQLAVKARAIIQDTGWAALTGVVGQMLTISMLLGAAFVVSWTFGREFSDQTLETLLTAGPSRSGLPGAKITAVLAWATVAAVLAALSTAILGAVLGVHGGTPTPGLLRLGIGAFLSALLAVPFAFVSTVGRSALAGVGAAIGMIMVTQLMIVIGVGAWFPYAAPSLWLGMGGPTMGATPVQLLLVVPLAAAGWLATSAWWAHAEL